VTSPATRVLTPEQEAFRAAFLAHSAYVYRTLQRLGVYHRDLQDEVHNFFLKVHAKWSDYDSTRPIRPWLLAFAVRHAADYRQLAHIRREASGLESERKLEEAASMQATPHDDLHASERRQLVMSAINAIDNYDQRALFVLHEVEELSVPEAAEVLAIPLNTAYSRLRTAREIFRNFVMRSTQPKAQMKQGKF
jgi:RNA polymerase sigma-70 factor, ECF subfamily